ncbi:MAG: helix-turn-helix domain containing protein [Lachnospiraceae bacterium]|nr:helix-turn-helix domain containing protein [Lachnospiraceae bacterium]MDY4892021.1 helix-turn-helix domain-containing protein [Agathobacter sp.]
MGIVVCYEDGMTMMEIAKRNHVSERTIYRYKAYYDQLQKDKTEDISRLEK